MPRPLRPQSGSTVLSGHVVFHWKGHHAHAELSRSRNFASVEERVAGNGEGTTSGQLAVGTWFWRVSTDDGALTSPVWQVRVEQHGSEAVAQGMLVSMDVNGDGFADVPVRSGVVFGRATLTREPTPMPCELGAMHLPELERSADEPPLEWGVPEGVGDVDGDGFADMAVLVVRRALTPEARVPVRLWFRGSSQLATVWNAKGPVKHGMHGIGDVDGDGYADSVDCGVQLDRCRVYAGSAEGPSDRIVTELPHYDRILGGADIDGDGSVDLVGVTRSGMVSIQRSSTAPVARIQLESVVLDSVGIADIDHDGRLEVYGVRRSGPRMVLWIWKNMAAAPLERPLPLRVGSERSNWAFVAEAAPRRGGLLVTADPEPFRGSFDQLVNLEAKAPRLVLGAPWPAREQSHSAGVLGVGDFDGDSFDDLVAVRGADIGGFSYYLYPGSTVPFQVGRWVAHVDTPPPEFPLGRP